jgi:hypothetical protein
VVVVVEVVLFTLLPRSLFLLLFLFLFLFLPLSV